jgi:hypothetical protein
MQILYSRYDYEISKLMHHILLKELQNKIMLTIICFTLDREVLYKSNNNIPFITSATFIIE